MCVCRALGVRFGRELAGGEAVLPWVSSSLDPTARARIRWSRRCPLGSGAMFFTYMRGARGLAAGVPAAGLRVRGCPPPVPLVREGRECRLHSATARFLSESSTQLLAGPTMRIVIGCIFLLEGIAEEPPAPLLGQSGHCGSPRHKTQAKALLIFCSADDDYVYSSFTSLEASSKSSLPCCSLLSLLMHRWLCHRSRLLGRVGVMYKMPCKTI